MILNCIFIRIPVIVAMVFFLTCCNGKSISDYYQEVSSPNTVEHRYDGNSYEQGDSYRGAAYGVTSSGHETVQRCLCQICGGNKMVVYFDGSLIPCYGCNGKGYLTVDDLPPLPNTMGQEEQQQSPNHYAVQLERELERHEKNLESLNQQLEIIHSSVLRAYLEQQVIEERYEIERLKRQLGM